MPPSSPTDQRPAENIHTEYKRENISDGTIQQSYVLGQHVCEIQHGSLHLFGLFTVDQTQILKQSDFVLFTSGARVERLQ